jgi:hypothetical protein
MCNHHIISLCCLRQLQTLLHRGAPLDSGSQQLRLRSSRLIQLWL